LEEDVRVPVGDAEAHGDRQQRLDDPPAELLEMRGERHLDIGHPPPLPVVRARAGAQALRSVALGSEGAGSAGRVEAGSACATGEALAAVAATPAAGRGASPAGAAGAGPGAAAGTPTADVAAAAAAGVATSGGGCASASFWRASRSARRRAASCSRASASIMLRAASSSRLTSPVTLRNSASPLPRARATSGSRFGPSTMSATTRITTISGMPIPNMTRTLTQRSRTGKLLRVRHADACAPREAERRLQAPVRLEDRLQLVECRARGRRLVLDRLAARQLAEDALGGAADGVEVIAALEDRGDAPLRRVRRDGQQSSR